MIIEYDDVKPIYDGTFRTFFMKARAGEPHADVLHMVLHEDGRILEVDMEVRGNGDIVSGRGMDKEVCELCFS